MAVSRGSGVGSHGEGVWAGHTEDMYTQLQHGWGPTGRCAMAVSRGSGVGSHEEGVWAALLGWTHRGHVHSVTAWVGAHEEGGWTVP